MQTRTRAGASAQTPRGNARQVCRLLVEAMRPEHARRVALGEALARARPDELTLLGDLAIHHRVAGVVYRSLRDVGVDESTLDELRQSYLSSSAYQLSLLAELSGLAKHLVDFPHPWLVLKGPVLAELAYGGIGLRQYGDLDLLTSRRGFGPLLEVIERAGGASLEKNWPLLRELDHGEITVRLPLGRPGDLHWDVVYYPTVRSRFTLAVDELLERSITVTIAGATVPALEPTDQLLHLCLHGALAGGHLLVWLKDVERTVARHPPDWDAFVQRARRYHLGLVCALVLQRAKVVLAAEIPEGVVPALAPDRPLRAWWSARDRLAGDQLWGRATRTGRTLMAATAVDSRSTLRAFARTWTTDLVGRHTAAGRNGRWLTRSKEGAAIFEPVGDSLERQRYLDEVATGLEP